MNNFRERPSRRVRKILFDARDCVFGRQYAAARHRAQHLARLDFLRRLLERSATGNEEQRRERDEDGAETHENEGEAMFVKRDHNVTTTLMRTPGQVAVF